MKWFLEFFFGDLDHFCALFFFTFLVGWIIACIVELIVKRKK